MLKNVQIFHQQQQRSASVSGQPCMPHGAACFRHSGKICETPSYIHQHWQESRYSGSINHDPWQPFSRKVVFQVAKIFNHAVHQEQQHFQYFPSRFGEWDQLWFPGSGDVLAHMSPSLGAWPLLAKCTHSHSGQVSRLCGWTRRSTEPFSSLGRRSRSEGVRGCWNIRMIGWIAEWVGTWTNGHCSGAGV